MVPEIGYGAAAPEVPPRQPRPAPRVPPRQPGAGAAAGRDAMEIHISSVPRAYLGSIIRDLAEPRDKALHT